MADSHNNVLEDARKRARRRLVGAVVLALAAAVVLPMFLESDPKPLGPDVQIQIPAIDDAKFQNRLTPGGPANLPAAAEKAAPAIAEATRESPPIPASAMPPARNEAPVAKSEPTSPSPAKASEAKSADSAAAETKTTEIKAAETKAAETKPETKGEVKAAETKAGSATAAAAKKAAATPTSAAPASTSSTANPAATTAKKTVAATPAPKSAPDAALPAFSLTATVPAAGAAAAPDTKSTSAAAPGEFVVQLGAFVDATVAKDLAAKAGEQGFSAFLESVTTKTGQVQRVRVGPFSTRADADAAAQKLKSAGFTAVARPR